MEPTLASHFKPSRLCLGTAIISNPLEEPLIGMSPFITRQHNTKLNLFQLSSMIRTPYVTLFVLESTSSCSVDPFLPRGSKTTGLIFSHMSIFLSRKTPRCFPVVSVTLSLSLESNTTWNSRPSGFKSVSLFAARLYKPKVLSTLCLGHVPLS